MSQKVYIASMNLRGKQANKICETSLRLNVTSAQPKTNPDRLTFSPMSPVDGGYKGYWNFESYWQSGKVFEDIPEEITKLYWKQLKEPKRRYPNSKNKKVLYANFDGHNKLNYIESRKLIYVPEYYNLINNTPRLNYWKDLLDKGYSVTIYDFDGPRDIDGEPICMEVDLELLKNKINDTRFPFGHGYVIASLLLDIDFKDYIV